MARINSRTKGANGEREVAALLQRVVTEVALLCGYVAPEIRRNTEQSQIGGEDLTGLPWWSIEVKRCERVELDKWWEQACVQARRKAPGSSSWDALAKGGWKRLAGAAQAGEAARLGSGGGSGLAPEVGSPVASEAARALRVDGKAGSGWTGPIGATVHETVGGVLVGVRGGQGGPLAAGGPLGGSDRTATAGGLLPLPCWGGPVRAGGPARPVPELVDGREEVGGSPSSSGRLDAPTGAREPVLIWRQSHQPWRVRFVATVEAGNGKNARMVADVLLDDWLIVLRNTLMDRLRGCAL